MVASTIMAVAMISVFSLSLQSSKLGDEARLRMQLLQHTRSEVESLIALPYTSAALQEGTYEISRGGFTGEYTVSVRAGTDGDCKDIVVRMDGLSGSDTISIELRTLMSSTLHG